MFGRRKRKNSDIDVTFSSCTTTVDTTIPSDYNPMSLYSPIANITNGFMFKGTCLEKDLDKIKDPKTGDIYLASDTQSTFVYVEDYGWDEIGKVDDTSEPEKEIPKILSKVKCNCCGATLKQLDNTHYKCEYCGTNYEYR